MSVTRRQLLKGVAAAPVAWLIAGPARAASYRVGIGRHPDPYAATARAIEASGEWPASRVNGQVVIVKPNIVTAAPAEGGAVTDPEVVRAVIDRALADGAREVLVVEAGPDGANFSGAGYDYLATYDPFDRVRLVDLQQQPITLAPVTDALAYPAVYVAELLLDPAAVFVSVAKLKTHVDAIATLSMKNLFGLPAVDRYVGSPPAGRFAMHDRGVAQTVIDLNRLRPIDFAVVDGVWGMEGAGPITGVPVYMETVMAGANAVAVDRIGLAAMEIPQTAVPHLTYASRFGLGPSTTSSITAAGDPLASRAFARPQGPPFIEYPRVFPASFPLDGSSKCLVVQWYGQTCVRQVEVVRAYDDRPALELVAILRPYAQRAAGYEAIPWDGRDASGSLVPPGRYAVHVRARHTSLTGRSADAVGWVEATAG